MIVRKTMHAFRNKVNGMHPVAALLDKFKGTVKIAEGLSTADERFSPGTIGAWRHRGSIPVCYWPRLIDLADRLGVGGVTNDALVQAHTEQLVA